MKRYLYEAVLTPNGVGGYDASFPDLGLVTQGEDLRDAVAMAQDLLCLDIAARIEAGEDVPEVGHFGSERPEGGAIIGIMALVEPWRPDDETMTVEEAAAVLDVSRSRVYAMIRDGVIEARKVGGMQMVSAASVIARANAPRTAGRPPKALQA